MSASALGGTAEPHVVSRLQSENEVPLWERAATALRADLLSGRYPSGTRLPAERLLCEQLGVSRVTLRRSLLTLVEEGLIGSSHGRGWYAGSTPRRDWPNDLESFSATASRMGVAASSIVVRFDSAPASLDDAELLQIAPGAELIRLERIRQLDGVPIALDSSRVAAALVPGILDSDFTTDSLYDRLVAAGIDLERTDTVVEARSASGAVAERLGLGEGQPVLVMRQIAYDSRNRPIVSSLIEYRGDRYRLRTSFARKPPPR